jgi:hypothetical protein
MLPVLIQRRLFFWHLSQPVRRHVLPSTHYLLFRRAFTSDPPPPAPLRRHRVIRRTIKFARFSGYFLLSSAFGILAIGAGIFIHDAFTYSDRHVDRVPVSPLALHPTSGGPKNLPIARVQVDDEEDEENIKLAERPRLVIVGGGWGVRLTLFLYTSYT